MKVWFITGASRGIGQAIVTADTDAWREKAEQTSYES